MAVVQKLRCTVERITNHGEHTYSLDLRPEHRIPAFRPGQFLHLALDEYDPSRFWPDSRVFSIASGPAARDHLQISYSVRGQFTARMESELVEQRTVWVKMPYGDFVVRGDRDAVLVVGGTGITAFVAFLESLNGSFGYDLSLIHGARSRDLLLYQGVITQCASRVPQLQVHEFVEDAAGTSSASSLRIGCVSLAPAWRTIRNLPETDFYLSGPPAMIKAVSQDLIQRGVGAGAIRVDAWK